MQPQLQSLNSRIQQSIAQFKQALTHFKREFIQVKSHSEPIDWCNPDSGECRIWNIEVRLPGRFGHNYGLCTHIQCTQYSHKRLPQLCWNSEHLAYHLADSSTHYSGVDYYGQEQEVTEYKARPLWGLLGEHTYSW